MILNAEQVEDWCCAHGRQQSHYHHHGKERRGKRANFINDIKHNELNQPARIQ